MGGHHSSSREVTGNHGSHPLLEKSKVMTDLHFNQKTRMERLPVWLETCHPTLAVTFDAKDFDAFNALGRFCAQGGLLRIGTGLKPV